MESTVVILAAGEGVRMKSSTPKVLHQIAGRSLVEHVLSASRGLGSPVVVIGAGAEQVQGHLQVVAPEAKVVIQERRGGTGHATRLAMESVSGDGPVLVVAGDTPLISATTLTALVDRLGTNAAVVLTSIQEKPTGYGRIVRNASGQIVKIVEEKDASDQERAINEVNSAIMVFNGADLRSALSRLTTNNAQGEEYLTDAIGLLVADGKTVEALITDDATETLGINDRVQLAACAALMRDRINAQHMRAGVTMTDPTNTWIEAGVEIENDVLIHPGTVLAGKTRIASGAVIGPRTTLIDCVVAANAHVMESRCTESEIGEGASVGPFSFLRPGTKLASRAKVGAYVEVKNASIGTGSKVPHLTYVGDATIGESSNIGAATVFVNYDGEAKHHTVVGDHVRIGSDTMLVAPVKIGHGAYTAAGSVITEDVPPGAMGVGRARQRNILGWVLRKRPGSTSARAASDKGTETGTV